MGIAIANRKNRCDFGALRFPGSRPWAQKNSKKSREWLFLKFLFGFSARLPGAERHHEPLFRLFRSFLGRGLFHFDSCRRPTMSQPYVPKTSPPSLPSARGSSDLYSYLCSSSVASWMTSPKQKTRYVKIVSPMVKVTGYGYHNVHPRLCRSTEAPGNTKWMSPTFADVSRFIDVQFS